MDKNLLNQVINMIPEEEKIKSRTFILDKSKLCFKGDRAWFVITNFINCGEILELTYPDIILINSLYRAKGNEDQFGMKRIDEYTVSFYNSQHSLEVMPKVVEASPDFDIRDNHEYSTIDKIIVDGIKLFDMKEEFSSIDSFMEDEIAYFALIDSKGTAIITGKEVINMDMRYSASVIKPAVKMGAVYRTDKDIITFKFDSVGKDKVSEVYVSALFRPFSLLDKQKSVIKFATVDKNWEDTTDDIVSFIVPMPEYMDIFPTIDKLEYSNFMSIKVKDGSMNINIIDISRRNFTTSISCQSTGNVTFDCRSIDAPALNFISAEHKTSDLSLQMTINVTKRLMKICALNEDKEKINSAVLLRMISMGNSWKKEQG